MMFIYITGIFVCMILAVYFLTRIQSLSKQKEIFKIKEKQIEKLNLQLDELHHQVTETDEILGKISLLSSKILNYRK